MFNIAFHILHDEFKAEDAVQNAFMKILKYRYKFDDILSPKTKNLLALIVRNEAITLYNKDREIIITNYEELDTSVLSNHDVFEQGSENEIFTCLNKLSSKDREVLMLKYVYGYSVKLIADLLGITNLATRKRLERAKNKLSIIIQGERIK